MDTALQSSVYVSSPEFAGWLMKRGFHWRKLWKKRWVALHGAEIVYMDKEPTIENSNNLTITKAQITTATLIDRDDIDGNPNGFAIHINDGHTPTWYLRAESAREKKSWLMRLQHVHAIVKWLEDFEKVKVLGVGGTGIVYELLHKSNGSRYAMKEMEIKNKQQMQMAISEAEMLKDIMENISHPNIMHIEKVFQVGSKFYLVFPLCTGGELYEHIIRRGHFTEHDAAIITRDLISGLHALHEHDILHLDIKPENLLFDSMGDNAKIKITDFGLSKLFSDQLNTAKGKFSMKLMEDRLRTLQETGELNREKLRGTIGYMAPELILTGHCSKATDVFAAGVVLFILLCGRPPFNSKSNREVLEKTARGQYIMTGAEWDDVSPEAKDLVAKMLVVNPEERISTTEIMNHAWIKQLDEEMSVDDVSSTSSGTDVHTPGSVSHSLSGSYRSNTVNRKGSGVNLANALRHLSGHVKQLQSEKFATNVTRLVSLMQQSGATKSTLSKLYLIPSHNKSGNSSDNEGNNNGKAGSGGAGGVVKPNEKSDEEIELLFLNSEFREGFAYAIRNLSDNDSGRLSIEQFMAILRYVSMTGGGGGYSTSSNNGGGGASSSGKEGNSSAGGGGGGSAGGGGGGSGGGGNNNVGLGPLIISKFIDRDGDGFITADDIFAAQALILQRSEVFLKVVFRIYAEAIWYPGRQLNLRSLMQQTPLKGDQTGLSTPGGSKVLTSSDSMLPTVVEPPKFITGRHVGAVFEKLGFESAAGQKAFTILCEALSRIKTENKDKIDENDDDSPNNSLYMKAPLTPTLPNAALARAFEDMDDGETPRRNGRFGAPDETTAVNVTNGTAAAAKRDSMRESSTVEKGGGGGGGGISPTNNSSSNTTARMDLSDFVRAVELDDVLVQVIFRKTRYKMVSLFQEAENRVRTLSEEDLDMKSFAEEEAATYNNNNNNQRESTSQRRRSRMSSRDVTADLIEQELKTVFDNLRASEANSRPTFPIANAVGRATLSAAMGLAAKVAIGTQALMEATYETFESADSSPATTPSRQGSIRLPSTSNAPKMRGVAALAGVDSDDEA